VTIAIWLAPNGGSPERIPGHRVGDSALSQVNLVALNILFFIEIVFWIRPLPSFSPATPEDPLLFP
jgi:hypothetical protein